VSVVSVGIPQIGIGDTPWMLGKLGAGWTYEVEGGAPGCGPEGPAGICPLLIGNLEPVLSTCEVELAVVLM